MLRRDHKVDLLRDVPLFAGCSKKELQKIARITDEIDLRKGKVLMRQGGVGREFFVLLEGDVDIVRNGRVVNTLGAGDFFGEMALVCRKPRNATVTATSSLRTLVVTERDFRELLREDAGISRKVLETVAARTPPGEND
jgi:CRP/FNR family cyclic AMP-dependent transcriptional regulator